MSQSIFATRTKELSKNKYIIVDNRSVKCTQENVASYLGISIDAYKRYFRNNANIPPIDIVKKIALLLNVDFAYLIGEQDYPSIKVQKISSILGISDNSAYILGYLSSTQMETFDKIVSSTKFMDLLTHITLYPQLADIQLHSKIKLFSNDEFFINTNNKIFDSCNTENLLKDKIHSIIDCILDDISCENISRDDLYKLIRYLTILQLETLADRIDGKDFNKYFNKIKCEIKSNQDISTEICTLIEQKKRNRTELVDYLEVKLNKYKKHLKKHS